MTANRRKIRLYAEFRPRRIVDDAGKVYTAAEAAAAFDQGRVVDYNLSFQRLRLFEFDWDKLADYYTSIDGQRP